MHTTALFLATISLLYNMAFSSPAPTPAPFLDPDAIQRRQDDILTGACFATSKAGEIAQPYPNPSPICQVDMSTVMACGPSYSTYIVDGSAAWSQATYSLTTDTAKATPAVYWQGTWTPVLVCDPQAQGFPAGYPDSTLCGYVGDEAECCNPADLTDSAQCVGVGGGSYTGVDLNPPQPSGLTG